MILPFLQISRDDLEKLRRQGETSETQQAEGHTRAAEFARDSGAKWHQLGKITEPVCRLGKISQGSFAA
jgi:hypothetical protein